MSMSFSRTPVTGPGALNFFWAGGTGESRLVTGDDATVLDEFINKRFLNVVSLLNSEIRYGGGRQGDRFCGLIMIKKNRWHIISCIHNGTEKHYQHESRYIRKQFFHKIILPNINNGFG